jgi:Zn-finger protein
MKIVPPEAGWPMACYCPLCSRTEIALNPWAMKPSCGDMLLIQLCVDEKKQMVHNLELSAYVLHHYAEVEESLRRNPWNLVADRAVQDAVKKSEG